jgi:hypothetical protein
MNQTTHLTTKLKAEGRDFFSRDIRDKASLQFAKPAKRKETETKKKG